MDTIKLAETVLLNLECFWVLQELEYLATPDSDASRVLDQIYKLRPVSWEDIRPLVRLNTTLSLLVVPMSFSARLSEKELEEYGFEIRPNYDLEFQCKSETRAPIAGAVLRVLRNAVAHLPDFFANGGDPNVAFDEGILRLWNRNGDVVVFHSKSGFVDFIADFGQLIRSAAKALIKREATPRRPTNKCS